jgi:hypothetical protein
VLRQSCAGLIWSKQMYPYRYRVGWTGIRVNQLQHRGIDLAAIRVGGTLIPSTS